MPGQTAAALAAMLFTASSAALGQGRPVELGMDMGVSIGASGGSTTIYLQLPLPAFRVAVPVRDRMAVEPRASLTVANGSGSTDAFFDLTLAGRYDLPHAAGETIKYAVLLPQIKILSGSSTATQFGLGAGFGMSIPRGTRTAIRMEADYVHGFGNDSFFSRDDVILSAGLTVFTH
jgi:hypothetical protein